jgi:hypothetical protein
VLAGSLEVGSRVALPGRRPFVRRFSSVYVYVSVEFTMRTTTLRSILLATGAAFALSWSASAQTPPASPQGFITVKEFLNIGGVTIADLTNSVKFPDSPDVLAHASFFLEWPAGPDEFTQPNADVKNNYGVQML